MMKQLLLPALAVALIGATGPKPTAKPKATPAKSTTKPQAGVDLPVLRVQVILSKLGFSPGVLDGKRGESLKWALLGFQESRGLPKTGKIDRATIDAMQPYANAWRATRTLRLDAASLQGPFTPVIPKEAVDKARLPGLYYRNALEALAERFHTTPATLIALNSPETRLVPGAMINFPNALPTSRTYAIKDRNGLALMNSLNVSGDAPEADKVVVDKSDGVLRAYDKAGKLIMVAPATMGSKLDPLPLGTWKILSVAYLPPWKYNPAILKKADKSDPVVEIKPGPNSPVGVVWIDLSKEHYGIHGTAEPEQIGRAESNGCIRLTNWDAARLSLMVKAGTVALFQA